jgi:hypothetical protein
VYSTPAGIGCPGDCSEPYPLGTVVTFIINANEGSTYVGSDCGRTVTMDTDLTCTFTFVVNPVLTVTLGGSGSGSVTSTQGGLDARGTARIVILQGR